MKTIKALFILFCSLLLIQCSSTQKTSINVSENEDEHELMVLDSGFESWLATQPSIAMYSYSFLRAKNTIFVAEYNNRVNNRQNYSFDLYPQRIEYSSTEEYNKELQYTLYNYFIYFQKKYNQRL